MTSDVQSELITAARVVSGEQLSDAFGHISVRTAPGELTITPPVALSLLTEAHPVTPVSLDANSLPAGVPLEAWIHTAIMNARPEIGAVVRAQPPAVAALVAAQQPVLALNGQAAFLGERVPVHGDSRLVRDPASGAEVAANLGGASAIILRGNGAVTTGPDLPSAVALMWVLERTAELNLRALAAGTPVAIPAHEQAWWRERAGELLPRMYNYLTASHR